MNLNSTKVIISIASVFLVYWMIRSGGWWFIIGLLIGMLFMAWSLLSGSVVTAMIVKAVGSNYYLDELRRSANARKKPKSIKELKGEQGL
jgi:membrane protein implicated in regulation of membrane protease activity